MAISNIRNVINDEIIRTRVDSINPNQMKRNTQNAENLKMPETQDRKLLDKILNDKMNNQEIHDAIDKLNKTIQIFNKRIKLSVHEKSKRVVIKIIDGQTDKVIREIPAKEVLNFIAKLHESIGVLIDEKK